MGEQKPIDQRQAIGVLQERYPLLRLIHPMAILRLLTGLATDEKTTEARTKIEQGLPDQSFLVLLPHKVWHDLLPPGFILSTQFPIKEILAPVAAYLWLDEERGLKRRFFDPLNAVDGITLLPVCRGDEYEQTREKVRRVMHTVPTREMDAMNLRYFRMAIKLMNSPGNIVLASAFGGTQSTAEIPKGILRLIHDNPTSVLYAATTVGAQFPPVQLRMSYLDYTESDLGAGAAAVAREQFALLSGRKD